MDKKQDVFAYSNEQLDAIVTSLSLERLGPYLGEAANDKWYAIKLYEWNTALSESFYGILQGLEIALRNSFHRALSNGLSREDWYEIPNILRADQRELITKAKARIVRDGKIVCPGKVIAELTFGFWVSLTGPSYAQPLWDAHLHQAFVIRLGRMAVQRRLEKIRKLRNRVAHHESILARNLRSDYSRILEALHWVCPTTAEWLKSTSQFHPRFNAKPYPPQQQALSFSSSIPEE